MPRPRRRCNTCGPPPGRCNRCWNTCAPPPGPLQQVRPILRATGTRVPRSRDHWKRCWNRCVLSLGALEHVRPAPKTAGPGVGTGALRPRGHWNPSASCTAHARLILTFCPPPVYLHHRKPQIYRHTNFFYSAVERAYVVFEVGVGTGGGWRPPRRPGAWNHLVCVRAFCGRAVYVHVWYAEKLCLLLL